VLDRMGKLFYPFMPRQTLKLCIFYIPHLHFRQCGPHASQQRRLSPPLLRQQALPNHRQPKE
jgi:hypothetical protein